ncbi:MAG: hypothetical protein DRI90_09190, partial [Deltaproteobacteria bacterium]
HQLGKALAELTPEEQGGLSLAALTALDGDSPTGSLRWPGSAQPLFDHSHEMAWLTARRTRLVRTLRRLRPTLFHAPYHLGTPRGSFVPRVVTCLDVVRLVLHDEYLPGRWAYRRLLHLAEALRFHSATRVMTISQHTADDIMRLLGVPASKIDVTLLGVDLERYRVPEPGSSNAALTRYDLHERSYFIYVGAADSRKNVDVMIRAFAQAKLTDHELVIAGKLRSSDERAYGAAMDAAGQPKNVRFLGFVADDDLPALLAASLGMVFCSTYEGFGLTPLEAMACGCPVIHTGLTSMGETIGDAGVKVPARDVAATADAIRQLATDNALQRQLRTAGPQCTARFTWKNTALATVASYQRALG